MKFVVDFRKQVVRKPADEAATETKSLGELLYHVLFGDGRMEPARELQS